MTSLPLSHLKVAVVGAGLIGLASARALLARGADVSVLEGGRAGQGASRAAAGMLSVAAESIEEGCEAALALGRESLALWPGFAADLERESRMRVGFRRDGALLPALGTEEEARLRAWVERARGQGIAVETLDGLGARAREPGLSAEVAFAAFAPEDWSVDNRALTEALAAAVRAAGGRIEERTAVLDVEPGRRPRLRVTRGGSMAERAFDLVVVAAGWTAASLSARLPELGRVHPVKGQMLSIAAGEAALRTVVRGRNVYAVPRPGGLTLIGATVEPDVSDATVDPTAIAGLRAEAERLLPGLSAAPVVETWAGMRPALRDGEGPLIAAIAPGVIAAVGHHRNGVLLTPVTAEHVAVLATDAAG